MIQEFGIFDIILFIALSTFGIVVGIKLGGQDKHDHPALGAKHLNAQIIAHGSMVMALAFFAPVLEVLLATLVVLLPQSGTDINKLAACAIVGLFAILWVVLPTVFATVRCDLRDASEKP